MGKSKEYYKFSLFEKVIISKENACNELYFDNKERIDDGFMILTQKHGV